MKLSRLAVILICSVSAVCLAQESTQKVSRTLPVRLNAPANPAPPPLPPFPAGVPARTTDGRPSVPARPAPPAPVQNPPLPNTVLAWDSELKEYTLKPGEMEAHYTFYFTNVSSEVVLIRSAAASCGCTVPKLPSLPWTNAPGASGEIPVTMNVAGKNGVVLKTVTINTDKGLKQLTVKATIPPPLAAPAQPMDRNKNQELAKTDRQAVFKGDCASCHVQPTIGKMGKELYEKACGICHEAEHRASMVTNLHALNHDTNPDFWKTWASQGKPGSLMPGFAVSEGGPLNDAQINSLVQYLSTTIPTQAVRTVVSK